MSSPSNEAETKAWLEIQPLLDDAMGQLGQKDRDAVVLRFLEGKSMAEVGTALGASENAAKKRVAHALDKLRKYFSKRGVVSTTAILAGVMSAHSIQAAPVGLAAAIPAMAVKGSAVAASTLALVKGTLKLMTMAKLTTAALIGAAVILATGTTVVVNRVVAQDSSVDDSAWAQMDTRTLNTLPPAFVLRPTHFATAGGRGGGGGAKSGNKMIGRAINFDMLIKLAYDVDPVLVVSPPGKPIGLYDLLVTDPNVTSERLQAEIKRQLGYVGRRESRPTDVLLLTVKQPNAPGLQPSQGRGQAGGGRARAMASSSSMSNGGGGAVRTRSMNSQNQPISILVKNVQGYFGKPIFDRTGLAGNYDVTLNVTQGAGDSEGDAIARALAEQLGLELAPSREAVEMLVVEKAK